MSAAESSITRRRLGFAGAMLALSLASLDSLIVATALTAIAGDLGDLGQSAWLFTWYLLASTCSMLLWGRLGDLYGRRRVLQFAVACFTLASLATGFSRSMADLAVGRALQGMFSSALLALPNALAAELVPARERGKYLAFFTGTWAVTSLLGPLVGGLFVDGLGWRWIFWFNVPTALLAIALLSALRAPAAAVRHPLDLSSAALLIGGVGSLVLAATLGGRAWAWLSWSSAALVAASAVLVTAFALRQLRAREPLLPVAMFASPVVRVGAAANFVFGLANYAVMIFIPLFAVVVMGTSATLAGLMLAPVSVGLFVAAALVGRRIALTGRYRAYPPVGLVFYALCLLGFLRFGPETPPWVLALFSLGLGLGSGPMSPVIVISIQNAVPQSDVGAASALAAFSRQIGQALGTAALGALMSTRLAGHLAELAPAAERDGLSHRALSEGAELIRSLPAGLRADVIEAFRLSIHDGYVAMIAVMLGAALVLLRLPQVQLATRVGDSTTPQVE
jgi:EmrB/QacA subfamily drug resistance transporter